jgi:hypothetical protein
MFWEIIISPDRHYIFNVIITTSNSTKGIRHQCPGTRHVTSFWPLFGTMFYQYDLCLDWFLFELRRVTDYPDCCISWFFQALVCSILHSNWTLHFPPKYRICLNKLRRFLSHWDMHRKQVRKVIKFNKTLED